MLSCNSQVLVHPLVHPLVRPICQVLDGSSGIAVYPKELVALWCAYKGDGSVMEVGTSFNFTYATVQKDADGEPMYENVNLILYSEDLESAEYSAASSATIDSDNMVTFAAVSGSSVRTGSDNRPTFSAGETIRIVFSVAQITMLSRKVGIQITEMGGSFATTYDEFEISGEDVIYADHEVVGAHPIRVGIVNVNSESGSCVYDKRSISYVNKSSGPLVSGGDSICRSAYNADGDPLTSDSYTNVFGRSKNAIYINDGVGGSHLSDIDTRFTAEYAGAVFIEGGANDLYDASTDPNASMRSAMTSLITKAKVLTDTVAVFNIPILDLTTTAEAWRVSYNSWLETTASSEGVVLVDLEDLWSVNGEQNPAYYEYDQTHPNALGHKVVADYLSTVINYNGDTFDYIKTTDIAIETYAPAVIEGKGLRNDVAYSTLFATLATETITLTAQDYCLQVFDSGSATCSYGTATVDNPLIFTATAGGTTFTPTGITNWMLTEGPYVHDQLQVGDSQSSTAGVHKIDMEEYKDVPDYVQLSGVI